MLDKDDSFRSDTDRLHFLEMRIMALEKSLELLESKLNAEKNLYIDYVEDVVRRTGLDMKPPR